MESNQTLNPSTTFLRQGETILWTGIPSPEIRFYIQGIIALVCWAIIAIISFIFHNSNYFIICYTVFAVLFFLFHMGYILFIDPIRRQKTSYEVTNQRVIIKSNFISPSVRQLELNSIKNLSRKIYKDGTGTIVFDKEFWLRGSSLPPYRLSPVFEFITEPDRVYDIIEKARASSKYSE